MTRLLALQPEKQLIFAAVPAPAQHAPILTLPLAFNELLDTGSLAQLEQLRLLEFFKLKHFANACISAVASDQLGALICGQTLDQGLQTSSPIGGAVPVARLQLGIKHQAQVTNPVGVDDVAGAPWLLWVVTHDCGPLDGHRAL